jgi:large subunit ribosomal protein L6
MSRIGKSPVTIAKGVEVSFNDGVFKAKGPKGELSQEIDGSVSLEIAEGVITLTRSSDHKDARSKHGLYRSLIHNMVTGLSTGWTRQL